MSSAPGVKDLVVLAADGQMEFAVRGLLGRGASLRFREISADIYVHPSKDPGCLLRAHDFLRPFVRQYLHAVVMFDLDGCGRAGHSREAIEEEVEQRLLISGWEDRAAAVVLDPELEAWVWSDSPEVDAVLGWTGRQPPLAHWLRSEGYLLPDELKPRDPKEALEEALRIVRKRRSSATYRELAQRVSLQRCSDPAFVKLKAILQRWFGVDRA
jgi:hypothetical protein